MNRMPMSIKLLVATALLATSSSSVLAQATLEEAVQSLATGDRAGAQRALLEDFPAGDVVAALANAVKKNPHFQSEHVRYLAYKTLVDRQAAQWPSGPSQLVAGLSDSVLPIQLLSARGLLLTPDDLQPSVAQALGECLSDPAVSPGLKSAVLNTLASFASNAIATCDAIRVVIADSASDKSLYWPAADAFLAIKGADGAWGELQQLTLSNDAQIGVLQALHKFGAGKSWISTSDATRSAVRDFVWEQLTSEQTEIRLAAMDALRTIFAVVVTGPVGTLQINPVVDTKLNELAIDDESEVREKAAETRLYCEWVLERTKAGTPSTPKKPIAPVDQ